MPSHRLVPLSPGSLSTPNAMVNTPTTLDENAPVSAPPLSLRLPHSTPVTRSHPTAHARCSTVVQRLLLLLLTLHATVGLVDALCEAEIDFIILNDQSGSTCGDNQTGNELYFADKYQSGKTVYDNCTHLLKTNGIYPAPDGKVAYLNDRV